MTAIDTGAAAPPATEPPVPYVGPRSLRPDEPIYGRTREINDLRGEILSERIVLLYSQSGAGKTSLIEAGLRPELEKRRFQILPTIRVGYEAHSEATSANRYRLSVITSLEAGRHLEKQLAPDELATISLADYLRQRADDEPDEDPCLVFDQFEEVFTLDPADWDEKEEFLRELGDALSDRRFFALFSMREDFIAQLDPFQTFMPTQFGNRYRLELLGPAAAREAIQMPAAKAGVDFSDEAADRLVDDLRRIRVDRGTKSTLELGPNIEPVQLQVVCSQLWERLPPDATRIQPDDVVAGGNVNEALAGYYSSQVHTVAAQTHVREGQIRDWFEDKLITDDGFRTQTRDGPGQKGSEALPALENAHLIRADRRRGTLWYELTHDRFVEPIRVSNAAYRAARRARRNRRLLILGAFVAGLVIVTLGALAASERSLSDGGELPATELAGTSATEVFELQASQAKRFRFNDGQAGDEVTLVIAIQAPESADSASVLPTDVDIRLLQIGTAESEDLAAGETRTVAPSGSTVEEASVTTTSEPLAEASTTSTTKAPQESARPIQRVFALPATGSYLIEITANDAASVTLSFSREVGSSLPELTIAETSQGNLETSGAVGRFQFRGEEGDTFELTLDPEDPLDGVLVLLDPAGDPIDSVDAGGVAGREVMVGILPEAGTYTANVSGFESSTGPYALTLRYPQVTPITSGESLVGVINEANESSTFSFSAEAGEIIGVTVVHDDTFAPGVEVSGESGRRITYADGFGGPIEYVGSWTGGNGLITVADLPYPGGGFTLTFERFEGSEVEVGSTNDDAPSSGGPQFYTFSGTAGEIYAVTTTGSLDILEVFAPDVVPVLASPFVAPSDGVYVIRVQPEPAESLTVSVTQPQLPRLEFGEQGSGDVEAAEQVAYLFAAEAEETYSISLDWTGRIVPWMLLVSASDGVAETLVLPWESVFAFEGGLSCADLFDLGLGYGEADLYFLSERTNESRSLCAGIYPSSEIDAYWDPERTTRLTLEGTAPFPGDYLFLVAQEFGGSYVVTLDR